MHLYLNTSNNLQTIIRIDENEFTKSYSSPRDQDVFGALLEALATSHQSIADIKAINIFTGPGSFTGLRVGISIANTLSLALNVPINGQPLGTVVEPNYGKPPGITVSAANK